MTREKITFKVPQVKQRMHRMLFDDDSPFRPKVVNRKDTYERRPKHKNKNWENENEEPND